MANKGASLLQGQVLNGDDYLQSPNGQFVALMQDDSNFVLYNGTSNTPGAPYWDSHTNAAAGSYHLDLQDNGNLVLYNGYEAGASVPWAYDAAAGLVLKLAIASGNNQTKPRVQPQPFGDATAYFGPLSVVLRDSAGNPLAGKQINWQVFTLSSNGNMIVQLDQFGDPAATSTSDAHGIATLNQMGGNSASVIGADGWFTIIAYCGDAMVTFNMTVGVTPPSILSTTIDFGNNQSVARTGSAVLDGIAVFSPLQVKVHTTYGTAAQGVQVSFDTNNTPQGMYVQLDPHHGSQSVVILTDAMGYATLNLMGGKSMNVYYAKGPFTVVASIAGGGQITFNETVSS